MNEPVTKKEVRNVIRKVSNNITAGFDGVCNEIMLKKLSTNYSGSDT